MAQPKLENPLVANFLFLIFTTVVATRTPRHSMARSTLVERVMATDSFKAMLFFSQISRTDISECRARDGRLKTEHLVARTFSQCRAHMTITRTCVWLKFGMCLHFRASQKSSTHNMFHRPLLDVPDPFPSFCCTPPPSAPTSLPKTGIHSARRITNWPSGRTHSSHKELTVSSLTPAWFRAVDHLRSRIKHQCLLMVFAQHSPVYLGPGQSA